MIKKISTLVIVLTTILSSQALGTELYYEPRYCSGSERAAQGQAKAGAKNRAFAHCRSIGQRLDTSSINYMYKYMSCSARNEVGRGASIIFSCKR